jgi:hypothetical protein
MAEIEDRGYGGSAARQSKLEKDDKYTPVHKTEEFKKAVRKVKEGQPIAPVVDPKTTSPQFNVPMPAHARPHRTGSSFDQKKYDKALTEKVREQVIKQTPAPSMGVSKQDYTARVEKETKRLVDIIKKPRYVFLADGTPFYLNKGDERAELEKSLLGESAWKRTWTLAKYDVANGVSGLTQFIGSAAVRTKELLTDTEGEKGNVAGALMQLGLNSAMLGWEYLRAADSRMFAQEDKLKQLEQEAEAAKYTDPKRAEFLMEQAALVKKQLEFKTATQQRVSVAGQAVDRAWQSLFTEVKESNEFANEHYDPNMRDPQTGRTLTPLEQQAIFDRKQKEAAKQEATTIRTQVQEAYASGDFERAIELTKEAQRKDREGALADPYGAYTWIREPEREQAFLEDAALLELQKGAPLEPEEIRRLKEYHANSWTEITGEGIFDPVNLIPAALMEKVFAVPLKTAGKGVSAVGEAVMKIPVVGKPVRWLLRESVNAGANRVARNTYNIFQRVSNAYTGADEVTKAMDDISNAVLEANRATNEQGARAIFEQARLQVPGLQQITFSDFKQLMDAGKHVDPVEWGKKYSDSLVRAEENLTESATRTGKKIEDVVSDHSKNRFALGQMADDFSAAFKDPHRIFKGARLTDDTIAGQITKTLRELSGDEVSELLVKTDFDEWIIKKSEKLGSRVKDTVKVANRWLEASLGFAAAARDVWATTVLTTFRWPINNLMDTTMRSLVYGGSLHDDLVTLFTSTQRTLADELGIAPLEFNNALAREGLGFTEQVPHKLLYEGWKPKFGIFSYIGAEYKRLLTEHGDDVLTKTRLATNLVEKLPDGMLKKNLAMVAHGLDYRKNVLTAIRAMPGGVSDFNTAIEFTFRLRMFHREYFKLLQKLEPKFMERGMDALSPATKEIAKQIWKAAEGNPRRITAYVDNLIGAGGKNTPAQWSVTIPQEIDDLLAAKIADPADRQLFISSVKNELDEFVETAARNGKELSSDDFKNFFNDYKTKMQDEIQFRLSQTHDHRGVDGSIRTDGQANPVPTENDVQGAMPIPKDETPRNKQIEDAIAGLNRKNKRRKPLDITNDLETAIGKYAKVERVSGDGVRVVKQGDKLVVHVGDNALKGKTTKFYSQINEAVISILKHQDTDLILHSGFASVDEYDSVMRQFLTDPNEVLLTNDRQFLTLAHQMENHPELRKIIEQTSPETVRSYDKALDHYRDIGEYSDVYGFNRRPDLIMQSEAERLRPIPGSHVAAQVQNSSATAKLAEVGRAASPEIGDSVRQFLDNWLVYRQELKQFYAFTYPGPLMRSTTEGGRHAGWDLFYRLSESEFQNEARIKQQLIELLQKDPDAAKKMIDDANQDFATYMLKENGIELEWDVDRQAILNIKVKGLDGKAKNFTSRQDIANLHVRFFSPQARKSLGKEHMFRIAQDENVTIYRQLRNNLRDTFQLPTAHADAWAKVIDNHAKKWVQETGQSYSKYYERLGFIRTDSSTAKGLGTMDATRIVKRGAVGRDNELGMFMFYGLSHSNFESMVRETGELFFDDLVAMADHSPQAADDLKTLKAFLEDKTGKKIRGNRLEQAHSDILADTFSTYVATGHGPDIKIKGGFDRLKAHITRTFDALRDTKIAGEIPDETFRVLDRMFTEAQIFDVPTANARAIRLMAKEADLVAQTEDELLQVINNALAQPTLTAEQKARREALEATLKERTDELNGFLRRIDEADDQMKQSFMVAHGSDLRFAQAEVEEARKALDEFDATLPKNTQTYASLGEVPKDVAARVLGTPEKPLESKISKELQEGWEVWKTQRGLHGFPDEALTDPDTFKAYLKRRMGEEWSELGTEYNRMLWEVEQFEDAMMTYHAGDDMRTVIFPRVHEARMSDGMKTFVRNRSKMVSDYEAAQQALDKWGDYASKMATEGHPAQLLTKEEKAALKAWAYGDGSKAKAELVDTLLNGNAEQGIEGAIPLVNKRMLDYQHTNNGDQLMKNFFPFWMFPSRSFPFWAETIATHPQMIAGYEKVQRLSRSQRYQSGAVTSKGKPLASLDGYIKIPGTDMWFNPLAPFSFRYLLDIQKSMDDTVYAAQSEDDVPPAAFLASEMMQTGQLYGFSMAPWATWSFKKIMGIPDEIIPRYPLIPEIQLIPRWASQEMVQRINQMFNINLHGLHEKIYPEAPWHDYMVERRILENALQQIQSGNLSEADKLKLMNQAQTAIKNKGDDPTWKQTYKEVTNEEATRSTASFFSGMYAKEFGDGEADLLALRNELNLLKSSLNNEFQANVFDLPVDAETGWANYLKVMDTPEGWVHRLYTDIGWVKNAEGEMVRDPKDRAKWLAVKIEQDEDQQMYYDKMSNLQNELNKRIRALPIGADWEQARLIYDWYASERKSLDYLRTFEKVYGTNKPVEMIQNDIAKDWFKEVNATRPRWEIKSGETYEDYQQRVMEWENNLPKIAASLMAAFRKDNQDVNMTIAKLHSDQSFDTSAFFAELAGMTNKEGLLEWEKQNDDVFDALNRAWKETYWSEYWNSVIGKDGYEVDLAEKDFYNKHPNPPSTDELYQFIVSYYGPEKFTREEIAKWAEGTDTLNVQERVLQGKDDPADYKKRQEIWDMLSWLGPGSKNRSVFDEAFANAGGDPDWLTTWYQESGEAYKTKPERLEQLHAALQNAVSSLGLEPPKREELVRYVRAQKENDQFKQWVNTELGNQFFDYEDEDGLMQQGVYSFYNSLDRDGKKKFRSEYPDEYDAIQTYYDMKEIFQDEHPTWADYYGFDTEPSVKLPEQPSGNTLTPPTLQGSGGGGKGRGGGGGGGKPEYRPTQTPYGSSGVPQFNIYDRTSSYVSPGLYNLIGNKMAGEVAGLFTSGRRISGPGVSFLMSVRNRYPEYKDDIDRILAKNG